MAKITKQGQPSKATSARLSTSQDVADIFKPSPLLDGEDEAEYTGFVEQCITAIKPQDAIERVWLLDFIDNTWDVRRLRRIKVSLVQAARKSAVKSLIGQYTKYALYSPEAHRIVDNWSEGEAEYLDYVRGVLETNGLSEDAIVAEAFRDQFKVLERIDGLIASYSYRRDAAIRELERRRDSLAKRAREFAKAEAEEAEFEDLEPKPKRSPKPK